MKTLLLIEDNDEIRENTAEILELARYKVFTAANGKIGVELALEKKPDLIICDIMMPVLDGYGVLHAIHRNEEIKNTPFIFLSAKTERGDLRKGMELGADDYITKPFDATELLNAVDSRLKRVELLKKQLSPNLDGLNQLQTESSNANVLAHLVEQRSVNIYKKKQVIYSEGNHPLQLYYVINGKVKTFKTNDDGKDLVTELYSPGDFLGHVALLQSGVYKETAEAMDDTKLAVIPKKEFENLLNSNWEVAHKFISLLAKNVADKEAQLLNMAYNSLRKKVADALVTLKLKYHKPGNELFSIDISRENLATIAGTATESLIRTLSDFKSEKLIEIRDGHISILNEKKLVGLIN
ncbi:MAG: response regulator [Sphingobacteriales bacterium]|nr:response regulator [Sphingobacteriales bacterium]